MNRIILTLLIACPSIWAQPWSGIIAPSRAVDWTQAGIPGGVPSASWTQCGPTIAAYGSSGSPASPSTISNALNHTGAGYTGCTPPYYIQLGAGTFYLNSGIWFGFTDQVELRGMGADSTFMVFSGQNGCGGIYSGICEGGRISTKVSLPIRPTGRPITPREQRRLFYPAPPTSQRGARFWLCSRWTKQRTQGVFGIVPATNQPLQ